MELNSILEQVVGTSPFVAFLLWYILTERKTKKEDKEYNRKTNDLRNEKMTELLIKNHEVLKTSQEVMKSLSEKYDDLKEVVTRGFAKTEETINNINRDVRECFKSKE